MRNKRGISGNVFAMIFAFFIIALILAIFLFYSSIYKPFSKVEKEFIEVRANNMAYQSLKNYLNTEIDYNGKISMQQLIELWSSDKTLENKLTEETDKILSKPFRNCYELRIPFFNGKPYLILGADENGFFSAGTAAIDNYAEVVMPTSERKAILVRLYLDTKCLGVEE